MQIEVNKMSENTMRRTKPRIFFRTPGLRFMEQPPVKREFDPIKVQPLDRRIDQAIVELDEQAELANSRLPSFQPQRPVSYEMPTEAFNSTSSTFVSLKLGTSLLSPFGSPKKGSPVSSPFGSPKGLNSTDPPSQSSTTSNTQIEPCKDRNEDDGFDPVEILATSTEPQKSVNATEPLIQAQNTVDFAKQPFQSPSTLNVETQTTETEQTTVSSVDVEFGPTSQTSTEPPITVNLTKPPFQLHNTLNSNSNVPPLEPPKFDKPEVPPYSQLEAETANSATPPVLSSNILTKPATLGPSLKPEDDESERIEMTQPSTLSTRFDPFVDLAIRCVSSHDSTKSTESMIYPVAPEKKADPNFLNTSFHRPNINSESFIGKFVNIETELGKFFQGRVFSVDQMFNSIILGSRSRPDGPLNVEMISGFAVKSISSVDDAPISSSVSFEEVQNIFANMARNKMEFVQSKLTAGRTSESHYPPPSKGIGQRRGRGANYHNKRGRGQYFGNRY